MSNTLGTVTNACGSQFYDSGGAGVNYFNNEAITATFCAPPGQYISFEFTEFDIEDFFDDMIIYNGPNTGSPIIGVYSGTDSPGTITSSLGGCITFDFNSDGSFTGSGWVANITCSSSPPSNGNICAGASPFCTGTTYNFPNNTGVTNLGTINCLFSTPNPVWYYFQIQNPGNLLIDISQEDGGGFGLDIDFNLWGPFASLADGCTQISAGTAPSVDCSYSAAAVEQVNAPGTLPGEVYILLLTNFSNSPGFITFAEGPGNTAGTDCDILCAINDVTAIPSACNLAANTYTLNGQISLFNPPTTGTLTVSTTCGGSVVLNAPFATTINYSIPNLLPTGGACNVTASFSDDPSCSFTKSYTSPNPCASNTLNCPQYASVSSSPSSTCGGQVYYLEVENTGCNGTITFNVVGNWGSVDAQEISWNVSSILTGGTVASGAGNLAVNGQSFNISVGPLNPAVLGNVFTLEINDSFGDGFNGSGGSITVQQPLGTNLLNPIIGNFGPIASTIFGANISISPATLTVNTPTGPIVNSVNNCKDFKVPITLQNNSFCSTTNVSLPWTIVCQSTGAVISSGTNNVTVYPAIPQNLSDVVDIQFDEATCNWSVSTLAGCPASSIGTIFNISPNPLSLNPMEVCSGGIENFELQYIGLPSSPNCCLTGGQQETVTYVQTFSNPIPSTSPFFSFSNHSALLTIPPNNAGGNAASLNLTISVNNYCFNPPSTNTATDYWITIVVDGQIVYDQVTINPAPINNTIGINLASIAAGYNETSIIQIYVYPNAFQAGGTNTVFNPNLTCPIGPDGRWRADISASIDVTFTEQAPTPASCVYPAAIPYLCCNPVSVSNASTTVCQGASIAAALSAWGNAVDVANDNCIVFSRVTPVAGSIAPDNLLPTSAISGVQTLGAYYYCDTDNNGSVNIGDTYTLISTFTATINAPNTTGTASSSPNLCLNAVLTPAITIATSGATGIGTATGLPAGVNASWSSNTITISGTPTQSGTFNYSIPLTGGCGSVNAIGTITVSTNPSASFAYAGTPFCVNQSGAFGPTLTGTSGGIYTSSPAGLSITSGGVITPSLSSAGTYTVTYSIAASGGCPAFASTNTVIVTSVPSTPSLLPNPICAGNSITLTAGNASYYSFAINGTEVQAPSSDNTWSSPALAAGDQVCVTAHPPIPFTFNGLISEPQWGNALANSAGGPISGFGSGNAVDALYLKNQSGYLFGALAGRVEDNVNNNKILVFLDTKLGGYNNLASWTNRNGIYFSIKNLDDGVTFDAGFEPDYIVGMNYAGATAFFDLYDMEAGSNTFLGTNLSSTFLGYTANSGVGDYTKGFEFALPLASIGNPSGSIKTFVMLVNDPGATAATTISNQFLTPAGAADGNYGNGAVNFNFAAPNPINYSLSAACSTQTCITVSPLPNANVSGDTEICSGESTTLNLSSNLTGTTFSWTVNQTNATGATNGAGPTINQTLTATGTSNGSVTYTFTPNSGGCNGNPVNSTITIIPTPTLTPIYHD